MGCNLMRAIIPSDKIKWLINNLSFEEGKNQSNKTLLIYFLRVYVCVQVSLHIPQEALCGLVRLF